MALQVHGGEKYPKSRLLTSSAGRSWATIAAELRSHPAGGVVSAVQQHVEVVIGIRGGGDASIARTKAGQKTRWWEGSIWLAPIGIDYDDVTVTRPIPEALHLYLPVGQFSLVADLCNLARSPVHSIRYIGGFRDDLIRQIGLSVLSEMTGETASGRMLAETSSLMLAARLSQLSSEASLVKPPADTPHRLDNARLRRILDHIEENLDQEITVMGLADVAHLSVFHFARMFAASIGVPPHRYVSRRRLATAMEMLAVGKLPLEEIAHKSCFSSQASFSRAFRRATGMAPGQYRRLHR